MRASVANSFGEIAPRGLSGADVMGPPAGGNVVPWLIQLEAQQSK
jgi:hypothetical protein